MAYFISKCFDDSAYCLRGPTTPTQEEEDELIKEKAQLADEKQDIRHRRRIAKVRANAAAMAKAQSLLEKAEDDELAKALAESHAESLELAKAMRASVAEAQQLSPPRNIYPNNLRR